MSNEKDFSFTIPTNRESNSFAEPSIISSTSTTIQSENVLTSTNTSEQGGDPPARPNSPVNVNSNPNANTNVNQSNTRGGNNNAPRRTFPNMPRCVSCHENPINPHATLCCGAIYCQECLMADMSVYAARQQPTICRICQRSMGARNQTQSSSTPLSLSPSLEGASDNRSYAPRPGTPTIQKPLKCFKKEREDQELQKKKEFSLKRKAVREINSMPNLGTPSGLEMVADKLKIVGGIVIGPICVICLDGSKIPVVSKCCQKYYCKQCLVQLLHSNNRCQFCLKEFLEKTTLDVVADEKTIPPTLAKPVVLETVVDELDREALRQKARRLNVFEVDSLIKRLKEVREQNLRNSNKEIMKTLAIGTDDLVRKFRHELQATQRHMEAAIQDKKYIDGALLKDKEFSAFGKLISHLATPSTSMASMDGDTKMEVDDDGESMVPQRLTDDTRSERLMDHFSAFCDAYHDIFNRFHYNSNGDPIELTKNRVNAMVEFTEGITQYGNVRKITDLNYDYEPNPSMSIISSLEFDVTGEHFVVAGVTKKIKVFNFDYVLNNPESCHFPNTQLKCQSKISNISWSPEKAYWLASSDYEGKVSLWDIEAETIVRTFEEHEKRVWSVNFNQVNPKLMASGSDDAKVKIWNTSIKNSVCQIDGKVNVCCVTFSPIDSNTLIFGCADHAIHLYDIRNTKVAKTVFRGHRKAVSYVRYLNPDQIVSASTDSTLRIWDANSGPNGTCIKILKGHQNEKNFVGLSANGDHLMCGSENSKAYFYYKGLSEPLAQYTVGREGVPEDDTEGFVSSVCWKKDTDYALIANSLGKVQLVEIY